ncbi:hypothetical protein H0V99_01215 [Candidatus Saccharibacteria bacterium]|nr:hypothetical protein [Candidatus Saccharibacteria bacterium]
MNKRLLTITLASGLLFLQPIAVFAQSGTPAEKREQAEVKALEARESKEERIAEIKQQVESRKLAIKQNVCEKRAAKLQAAIPKLSKGATSVKIAIDKMYERVQGFYESGQLTVDNYQELVDAIELSKANAETALETVENYEFVVDCESETVGQSLDAFRAAVNEAKTALKQYRKDLVELISSLKSESASQNQESEDEATNEETNTEAEAEGAGNE